MLHSDAVSRVSAASVLKCLTGGPGAQLSAQLDPMVELCQNLLPFSGNMLELHFDRHDTPFDFAFRVNKDFDAPLLDAALLAENKVPFMQDGYHQLFQRSMPGFRYGIENICFEYDFPLQTRPAIFFDLNRNGTLVHDTALEDLKKLASVFQHSISEELPGFFARVRETGLTIVYYGFMLSRKSECIRLTVEGVTPDKLIDTVVKLGWTGNYDLLHQLQNTYLRATQRLVLCVDFDKCLGQKLGIEVHDPDWNTLLKKLATTGICNEKQYALLTGWCGKTALSNPLSAALTMLHQRPVSCVFRRLNHFKFTVDRDMMNTKAYLYYCF